MGLVKQNQLSSNGYRAVANIAAANILLYWVCCDLTRQVGWQQDTAVLFWGSGTWKLQRLGRGVAPIFFKFILFGNLL